MQLHKIPHIFLNTEIVFNKEITKKDLEILLRIYKSPEETLSEDLIYSPFIEKDKIFKVNDDYNDRTDIVDKLHSSLPRFSTKLNISYNFAFTPVKFNYSLDGEFPFIGQMLEETLSGTNLSLELLMSHFNQFANKAGTKLKDEHYHCLIGNPLLNKTELDYEINVFLKKLRQNQIIKKIIIKE